MEIEAHSRPRKRGPVRQRTRKPVRRNLEGLPDDDDEKEPDLDVGAGVDKADDK